jgi:hypothetical protein
LTLAIDDKLPEPIIPAARFRAEKIDAPITEIRNRFGASACIRSRSASIIRIKAIAHKMNSKLNKKKVIGEAFLAAMPFIGSL